MPDLAKSSRSIISRLARMLANSMPPYRVTQGKLESKQANSHGKGFIKVNSTTVEVDSVTLDALDVGETLRVRYTRDNRAIVIDRIQSDRPEDSASKP